MYMFNNVCQINNENTIILEIAWIIWWQENADLKRLLQHNTYQLQNRKVNYIIIQSETKLQDYILTFHSHDVICHQTCHRINLVPTQWNKNYTKQN